MNTVRKLSDLVYSIEKILACILALVMSLSLIAGVIFRYFLNSPLVWSDELALFTFIWVSLIGGSMALKKQTLSSVSIIMDQLKGRLRFILLAIAYAVVMVFCIYFFWISIPWIIDPSIMDQNSSAMEIPMLYPYLSVPVSLLFMSIHSIEHLLFGLQSIKTLEDAFVNNGHGEDAI